MSAAFKGAALIRGEAPISMWIPKGAALIRGQRLFETWRLLEEIRYVKYRKTLSGHNLQQL